ncbi:MAG TPA: ATP-binding protein, partial [Ktedonobacteraceae bacterium]|nr:ATP-binding protein [Ktedonobacteraceae bacterium]
EMLDNVYQTGEPASFTEMVSFLAAADGSLIERFFDGVFQAWYDADGKIAGVMNFAVDVTEKARARQQIEDLATELQRKQERLVQINEELLCQRDELSAVNIELEHSNQARKRFLSTTSHELRTPLTSILGFSRILLQNAENANWSTQEKDALVRILKNGEHLLALINDVLDLARIDSGRVEITTSQVEIRPLFTSILEDMQPLAQERGLILRIEVLPEVQSLQTDGVKLRQILLNLVANAIKFTERGEIIISATRTTCAASTKECLALAVEDTGIGILPEHHERLFESFYQVDGGSSRRFGGTGLGLAIVHQLTTLLGGTISVASEPGKGSTFTVTLPCEIESSQVTP